MRRRMGLIATLLTLAMALVACGNSVDVVAPDEEPGEPTGPESADPDVEDPDEQDPEPPQESPPTDDLARIEVFYVRSGIDRQWVEPETRWISVTGDELAEAAMRELFTTPPSDPDLSTAAPDGVTVLGVERDGDVLVVDVDDAIAATSGGSAQEVAFAQQLAHTAALLEGIESARLTVGGATIDELWGHIDWSVPIERDEFALSPITIIDPPYGAEVPVGPLEVRGEATVFEATLWLRLVDAGGNVVEEAAVMASEGGPGRGDWTHTFEISEPGEYRIEAEEPDPSDGEGRAPLVTTRTVLVRG